MSKEDILDKYPSQVQGDYYERHCLDAMDEYAEKVAVEFAEWFKSNVEYSVFGYFSEDTGDLLAKTMPDLYQYFITNVYNK